MNQERLLHIIGWIFGSIVLLLGSMNVARGNDFEFGIALMTASTIYFPPTYEWLKRVTGLSLHYALRVILAALILWVNLAVGAINEGYYPKITG